MLKPIHIVNSVFTSRTYVLIDDSDIWLVDCGDVQPLLSIFAYVNGGNYHIKGVLITHAHFDHIYGLPKIMELFPDVYVYTNEYGKLALSNEKMNLSRYHGVHIEINSDKVIVCGDGDVIDMFDDWSAKVIFTPGHNPSCLTFEMGDYLFTGDAYIPGCKVVTNLPDADKKQATESVARIKKLSEGKIICPGHEIVKNDE